MNKRVFNALRKRASASGDFFRALPSMAIPYVGSAVSGIGGAYGSMEGHSHTKEEILDELEGFERNKGRAWIPGVGPYRLAARQRLLEKLLENTSDKDRPRIVTRKTGTMLAVLNPLNWVAAPIAGLAAALTPTRELDEQAKRNNDKSYRLKSFLIPGWNAYNSFKTVGASNKVSEGTYTDKDLDELDPETRKLLELRMRANSKERKDGEK